MNGPISPEWQILVAVLGTALGGGLLALIRGGFNAYKTLQQGQSLIVDRCQAIQLTLRDFEGRFKNGETWMQLHQAADDKAFASITEAHREIKEAIDHCSDRHHD